MAQNNLSNKKIAQKLGIETRNVALQLSRMRKKAKQLEFTYKIQPGAEHAQNSGPTPVQELKEKLQNDPGFISLMYQRYGTEDEPSKESSFQLVAAGGDQQKLFKIRAKHLKTLAQGSGNSEEKILLKLSREQRRHLKHFLSLNKMTPMETFWDDSGAIYKVTPHQLKEIQKKLQMETDGKDRIMNGKGNGTPAED